MVAVPGFDRPLGSQSSDLFTSRAPISQTKKKKDFWTDQISTGGGIGGALGGAATGAAIGSIVPGIGTVIGGLAGGVLGGALGSGGGELVENTITGADPWENVGKEALLGGIFSAPPIRAARGLVGAAKGIGSGAAKEGFEQAFVGTAKNATRNTAQRTTNNLLGEAWGIRSGAKVGGKAITPQKANELQNFVLKDIGVPKTSNADMVFERATNYQNEVGNAIGSLVKTGKLEPNAVNTLSKSLSDRFSKTIGVDAGNNQVANDIIGLVNSAKSPEDLWKVRRQIDDTLINFSRNPTSIVPGGEQIARTARAEINSLLNKVTPGLKDLNTKYSRALDVSDLVAGASKNPKGFKLPGFQQTVGGGTAQRIKAGAGAVTSKLPGGGGSGVPTIPGSVSNSTGGLGGLIARQTIGQNTLGNPGSKQPTLDDALMQQGSGQLMQTNPDGSYGAAPFGSTSDTFMSNDPSAMTPPQQDPYPRENLLYDIQRDPQNADQYIAYYQQVQEVFGRPEQKSLSSTATKDVSNANVGLQALDQIEGILGQDPGVQQRGGISGTFNPFGIVSGALGTGEYENARAQARDVIARIRTGAALTNDEARAFDKFLPQPGDDANTVKSKLSYLRNQFQAISSQQGGGSLEDALLTQQRGAY